MERTFCFCSVDRLEQLQLKSLVVNGSFAKTFFCVYSRERRREASSHSSESQQLIRVQLNDAQASVKMDDGLMIYNVK